MLRLLRQQHLPPGKDAESRLKRQLAWFFLLRVIFLTLILGITAVLEAKGHRLTTDKFLYPLLFIAAVYLFTIISAALLSRIDNIRRFASLQIAIDILLISCLVFFSGTSQSLFTVVYFLPIIAGSFMLFHRGALLMAALCTMAYGGLLLLEYIQFDFNLLTMGPRPATSLERLLNLFAINGLSFFFVAGLGATLAHRLYRTEAALSRTTSSLDRLNNLYKQIFDDIASGIVTVNKDRAITSFNRAAERISGYRAEEAIGRPVTEIFAEIRYEGNLETTTRAEGEITRKNGDKIPLGYSWSRLHGTNPEEKNFILSLRDLSRIREMEARIRQSEKMAAVGEMAAGIAHEFRNPLAAISGSAQLLARRLQGQPDQANLLAIITRECDRLEAAIKNFLLFSRPANPNQEWVNLNELCEESATLLSQTPTCSADHHLTSAVPANIKVWADREQLRQVIINLLSNACQAMPAGGTIESSARREIHQGRAGISIKIRDNGKGMTPQVQAKIFNPYFTTRQEGTGLGLAIAHQIINGHGGQITVHSMADQGTTFTVHLPDPA